MPERRASPRIFGFDGLRLHLPDRSEGSRAAPLPHLPLRGRLVKRALLTAAGIES